MMSRKDSSNPQFTISDFYCTECGQKGISIARNIGQQRKPGHLKKLYCLKCHKETNHAEIPPVGSYTFDDFKLEYKLGRFVDGQRMAINELKGCKQHTCYYNVDGKCWNANHSYQCSQREEEMKNA